MSNRAMNWAVDMRVGRGVKAVLMCLADHATDHSGEDWQAWPSVSRISEWTEDSRATVERHLAKLERLGVISRTRTRRADGKLGHYVYRLHRNLEQRLELAAERGAEPCASDQVLRAALGLNLQHGPGVNLQHGPCVNLSETMLQNAAEPCCILQPQEPLEEPLEEPSQVGREPGDHGFDELVAAWPESGCKRTSWPQARAAFAFAFATGRHTAEDLIAAARACAVDPVLAKGDHGWPGLHRWLSEERFSSWLPKVAGKAESAPEAEAARTGFAGPAELVAELEAIEGVGLHLARCTWSDEARQILAPTGWTANKLRELIGKAGLERLAITVERRAEPATAQG